MSATARAERSETTVRRWVEKTLGWEEGRADVVRVPHLGTPSFDFFVVSQRRLAPAGDIYVMTDGSAALPPGRENLAKVLAREGFPLNPSAIPAAQLAELFLRMAAVRPGRVIAEASDFALRSLEEDARASFAPPRVESECTHAVLTFWAAGLDPTHVERWRVEVAADGSLADESETIA